MSQSIGLDLVDIARFSGYATREHAFLEKTFTALELDYCFAHADFATHLAGTFAAKEAVAKALDPHVHPLLGIEIRRTPEGKPEAYENGEKLSVTLSISHAGGFAAAVALG